MRREGWASVVIREITWTSQEWLAEPVKQLNGPFLIVGFHSWHTGSATPDGNWQFSSNTNSMVEYNKGNTNIKPGASATEVVMESDLISLHRDRLTYTVQTAEPQAYTYLKIIMLQRG